jgi:hypothetical protein
MNPGVKRIWGIAAGMFVGAALLLAPAAATADVQFGSDPSQPITPTVNCGGFTCTLFWSNPSVGTDLVPIPVTGGSGTVTSVTLPAMPNPGTMQAVVLGTALSAGSEPSKPDFICCQVKALSPTFTVPANQVTTVPLALRVSATEGANLSKPGDTAFEDAMAISVLTPGATAPLRETGAKDPFGPGGFDGLQYWSPALTQPSGEYNSKYTPAYGIQLLARFNLVLDGAATPGPVPTAPVAPTAPTKGPAAATGLKLNRGADRVGADGKTVSLGTATNPPTTQTSQQLLLPTNPTARAAAAGKGAKKPGKPTVLGSGKTKIAAGRSAALSVKLNGKGKTLLKKQGRLNATLRVVAVNAQGETQTKTSQVTIKPAPPKRQR